MPITVERLSKLLLMAEPDGLNYSVSLDVMGAVQDRKGQRHGADAFMKTRLFDPLGMRSTGFRVIRRTSHLPPRTI